MADVFTNDLRIREQEVGSNSGAWGGYLNTSLENIAEAFSYGTEALADSAAQTLTLADGASDELRSFYLKLTGTLSQATTVTLAPNTISKCWIIENATTGGYDVTISQGSGANVTVGNGNVKMIATDGAGAGGVVYDLFTDLELAGGLQVIKASSGATPTSGTVLTVEDDDNAELSILGGSSSLLALNFGHSGDADDGIITYNTTSGSEAMGFSVAGGTTALTLNSTAATFGGQVIAPNGSTSGYYLKQTGGTATPRVTNDGNEWTIIRPGASGADVAINNYANTHNRVVFRDEGDVQIGDGNLIVASGHGIDFGATSNGGGNLGTELLNDYEDGTWTPVLIAGTTNPTGGAALAPTGRYTKIGNRVWLTFYVGRSWTNSPSGQIYISGLPFTVLNNTNGYYTGSVATYNVTFGSSGSPFLIPDQGSTTMSLYSSTSGGVWVSMQWQTHAASSSGTYVTGALSYQV